MACRYRHPMFKGRHFDHEIIFQCVRWYVTYKLSYRDLDSLREVATKALKLSGPPDCGQCYVVTTMSSTRL